MSFTVTATTVSCVFNTERGGEQPPSVPAAQSLLGDRERSSQLGPAAASLGWRAPSLTAPPSRSVNGDVRFFDPRMPESVSVLQIVKGLTALDIHPQANLIAW